jgi:crotonobetainyl-CoA:carnitine CoA-transferase CaiB-like acyl-CoA transferase
MAMAALRELLALGKLDGEARIDGADPVLRTPFRVGAAGAAALAAVGIAAANLWHRRTGRRQQVALDLGAAAASLKSGAYLRIDGKPPPAPWDPMSGFYAVRDGRWVSIHCNFANHRKAALEVLGTGEDREQANAAAKAWDGAALEEAIHTAGGCAGLARSAAEWAAHPHAAAVAQQPLLEILRIGDAPPEALGQAPRPLSGIRVLDLTRVLAGPTCAKTLAEHGADVLKITAQHLPDSGAIELDTGIGKLAAFLDLRTAGGVSTLGRLLQGADVFSQSYRPGALARRGFSPEEVARLRPGIVCASLNAWGQTGPWKDRRGFDSIVQTVSGMALAQGDGSTPKLLPCSAIDYVSGYLMAYGVMVALARRAAEGGSWLVRVALARTGRWIVDRGTVDPAAPLAAIADGLTQETDSPAGRITHLRPVLRMSDTPPRWDLPPVPLGYSRPEWP